jgi:hypothetical protein
MNVQERKIAIMRSGMWSFLVVLGMASAFNFALVITGVSNWISTSAALFPVLGTLALTVTMFSIMLGGGTRKVGRNAAREQ